MEFYLITFRTITPAQRGEQLLRRMGVACNLQRTPRWMEAKGCGYSLKIPQNRMTQCLQRLREGNISFQKIYLWKADGTAEEVTL